MRSLTRSPTLPLTCLLSPPLSPTTLVCVCVGKVVGLT